MRLLIHRCIRADSLCEGGAGGGRTCALSSKAECSSCRTIWEPEDTSVPGRCPECSGYHITIQRCDSCPVEELHHVRAHSYAGRLFERILELEFDLNHFAVPWSEVTAEEVKGLQILKEERDTAQREEAKEEAKKRGL